MATEDLTTYTEVDAATYLSKTSTTATFTAMVQNAANYIYDDKGSGHFDNAVGYDIDFEHNITAASASDSRVFTVSMSNSIGVLSAQVHSMIALFTGTGPVPTIADIDDAGATDMVSSGSALSTSTRYYNTFALSGTTLDLDIYTDSGRTTLDQNVTGTIINTGYTYQYFYALSGRGDSGAATISGDVQNIDLNEAAPTGAIINQLQGSNMGADLYNGSIL